MALKEILSLDWAAFFRTIFEKYTELGRPILDVLYIIFDGMFNIFLVIMILASTLFLIMTLYTFIYRKKEPESSNDYFPTVTVQIPTYNELVALRCAKSCLNFDYPQDKFEILIGDDSSNPQISEKIAEFSKLHEKVKVIKRTKNTGYKPGNLNNMLKHSNGEILLIFDSDFVPEKDFLRRIVQPFSQDKEIGGVQARWTFMNQNENLVTIMGATILTVFHHVTLPFIKRARKMSYFCGSAEAVRKDILLKLGGWDAGNTTEDIEYSVRLINKGYRIHYLEDLTCTSEVPYTTKDLYRQQMRWAYGVIHTFKKHAFSILKNKKLKLVDKLCMTIICSGYLLAFLLLGLFTTGVLSLITHAPEPINWSWFLSEMGRNVLLTSGLLIASTVALNRAKNGLKPVFSMLISSLSVGVVTTYYVNKGIYRAIVGRPVEWYMLMKKGNEAYST